MRRLFDVACALLLLVLLSPLFAAIVCAVKYSSPGPVIFAHKRMGYRKQPFTIYKFRTMLDESGKPSEIVGKGDPRVTRAGAFLRSTYLDELPQLWNIVKGDMTFVGPRPYEMAISEKWLQEVRRFEERFAVRPGLTGPLQLLGREATIEEGLLKALEHELCYIEMRTFTLDLLILCRTLPKVLRREGI